MLGMWTRASRGRMAEIEKRAKRYPTDLTDEEWLFIQPFLPAIARRGRKPKTDLREVLDALRYLARTGGGGCCRTISPLADGLLVAPTLRSPAAVPDNPRCCADA